jgi:succinyl-CoA synthetase beta subunit
VAEADKAAAQLIQETSSETVVVKAQIHAGGRGKGGGVKVVKGAAAAHEAAQKILGMNLVTHQTGPEGRIVKRLLIEQGMSIAKELYAGMLLDRATGRIVVMASSEGGMDIEEVAAKTPEKILKETCDPVIGLGAYQARNLVYGLGLRGDSAKSAAGFLMKLYQAFVDIDAALVEINPLVVTTDGKVLALDCKMTFDDNALYRHKEVEDLRDLDEEDPSEIEAKKYDLSFIKLEGTIGCMVNGAGLAMATMDIIKHFGGQPANFLDVGGGATAEKVTAAFKIITTDPSVKAIFVNIFGGIMRCDWIAQGLLNATNTVRVTVPIVVRLAGTNVEEGRRLLTEARRLSLISVEGFEEAAQQVVALAKKA